MGSQTTDSLTSLLELTMIAESFMNAPTAHGANTIAPADSRPGTGFAGSKSEPGDWKCPMCMEDVELYLFQRSLRDSVRSNPKLWKPLEKGLDALLREDPVRSGSLAEALREMVNRNPRLLAVLEDLLNGPSVINDWEDSVPHDDPKPGTPHPPNSKSAKPHMPPTSQSPPTLAGDRTRQLPTSWNVSTTAFRPPAPQNATLGNTVATVASVCNNASTAPTPEPITRTPEPVFACSDRPTAPFAPTHQNATVCSAPSSAPPEDQPHDNTESELPALDFDEGELRRVYGDEYVDRLADVGKSAHWDSLDYRNGLIREAQKKGGRVPLAWFESPPQETTDPTPSKLKVKQQLAITALLGGASQSAAAEAAGVDRSTLYRWMKRDAEFVAAYNRVKHDHYDAIHARMFQITNQMMDTLENLFKRPFSTTSDRLRMISVGLQLRKQIMAQRAPDCPTDAKFIENTWRGLGVDGPYCHEFPASAG
jgi:hypothetical protein